MNPPGGSPDINVLLFGASNLTIGWKPLMQQLLRTVGRPVNVHACLGMGRSWLKRSRYMARTLPAILDCGLWNNLPAPRAVDRVLITDIGNDIVYQYHPVQIRQAIDETLHRIRQWNPLARISMTLPPLVSLQRLHPLHFRIVRTLLFPTSQLAFSEVLRSATQLHDLLQELNTMDNLQLIHPQRQWYGADPIHILRSMRAEAFQTYFKGWGDVGGAQNTLQTDAVPLPTASERTVFGRDVLTVQPVFRTATVTVSAW
ncbi:MAG: hypothetical protein RLZZ232_706 [Planctomycetota bacterium]|jgi:hypothetical protein